MFYLPGYLRQSGGIDAQFFLSPLFHFHYMVSAVPQILLLLYILSLTRNNISLRYGMGLPKWRDIPAAGLSFIGVGVVAVATSSIAAALDMGAPFSGGAVQLGGSAASLSSSSPLTYLLILITCTVIGYHEELYFRAYILTEFGPKSGSSAGRAALAGSLLFAGGHMYQGIAGFLATFGIGLFLSYRFLRRGSLHEVAIAHALYNFTAILVILSKIY